MLKERKKESMVVHESIRVGWKVNLPLNLTISSKGREGGEQNLSLSRYFFKVEKS